MLTKITTIDTGEIGARSGKSPELIDSMLLSKASRIATEASIDLLASRGNDDWITLFRALAELTSVHAEAGDPTPCFSMTTLLRKCGELDPDKRVYWLSDDDTSRKKFTKAWDNLTEIFPGLESNLCQRAAKQRVAARVLPRSQADELDKRARLFGLQLVSISLPTEDLSHTVAKDDNALSKSASEIEYVEEMEVYPIPGFRRPLRVNVQGWRSLFLVLPPALVVFTCLFGAWVVLEYWQSAMSLRAIAQATITIGIMAGMLLWMVWPLYRLLEDRIIIAPAILQFWSVYYHVLVIRKEDKTKIIRMLRFTGTCPICGGLVEIAKGRGSYRGRFVGKCETNPIEHVFSFDHVLRRGRWLRN